MVADRRPIRTGLVTTDGSWTLNRRSEEAAFETSTLIYESAQ